MIGDRHKEDIIVLQCRRSAGKKTDPFMCKRVLSAQITLYAFYESAGNPDFRHHRYICQRRRKNVPDGGVKVYQSG
jgi:hypothetical protein